MNPSVLICSRERTKMRKIFHSLLIMLLLCASPLAANNKTLKAEDILKAAQAQSADQNKPIFLIFGASWCEACHQLDTFLAYPEIAPIFEKYFIVARLTFGEGAAGHRDWDTPGSESLIEKYGGVYPNGNVGLPFIAILDAKARLITSSNQPGKANVPGGPGIGFPTASDEIKWFLSMLVKSAPAVTPDETAKIQAALPKAAAD
jgi:thiol-disulfide isomerase/thioredoxin